MELDKQTHRNYNELYELLLSCYKDASILKAYEEVQKKKDLYDSVPNVSNHFVKLVQKDLALTLWKIYYDTDSKANTVPKFRNTINKLLRDNGREHEQVKQEMINKNTENKLIMMRRQFLAHTDMNRKDSKILICELKEMLDAICKEFNNSCNVICNDKIRGVSEINIGWQEMNCYAELLALYSQK